ncbi:transmembrane protein, putative [Medicago truncatula]|uniref:Transmembrane protein, putative n=1 Tax=Medicago truncatula TaxID=3880 RepID=G7KTF5_MEDTR|nr:transmembrane protein, putative [Medicago truncatula]
MVRNPEHYVRFHSSFLRKSFKRGKLEKSKENSLMVDWRDKSLPKSRSSWTELGKHFLVCLFLFSPYLFACGFELFTLIPRLDLGVVIVVACVYFDIDYYFPLLHTS